MFREYRFKSDSLIRQALSYYNFTNRPRPIYLVTIFLPVEIGTNHSWEFEGPSKHTWGLSETTVSENTVFKHGFKENTWMLFLLKNMSTICPQKVLLICTKIIKKNIILHYYYRYYSLFHKTFKQVPYLFILCITYNSLSLLLKETIMEIRLSLKKLLT